MALADSDVEVFSVWRDGDESGVVGVCRTSVVDSGCTICPMAPCSTVSVGVVVVAWSGLPHA